MSDTSSSDSTTSTLLPQGTVAVGIGLFVAGISTYAFFKVGQLALGKEHYKPIMALWFITFALVPGFFMPVEQELGRALAHRRALNQGGQPVVRKMIPLVVGLASFLIVVVLVAAKWLTNEMFDGYVIVTIALILTFFSYSLMHVAKGIASGSGRFDAYGIILGVDSATRIIACIILWKLGVTSVGPYALAVALSPLVAFGVVALRGDTKTQDGPVANYSEITPNLGWLLLGSIMAAALVNAGPLGVDILANSQDAARVTAFGNGVLLSRVPLFLFQAVQAALLPRLARLVARGDIAEFRRGLSLLMKILIGVAVLGTVGSFLVGPQVLDLVYDGGLDRRTLALLTLASSLYMIALGLAQAVIALQGHKFVAIGWLTAMVSFIIVTIVSSNDIFLRVELGLVAGSVGACVVFILAYRSRINANARPDLDSMIDGVLDHPLEG